LQTITLARTGLIHVSNSIISEFFENVNYFFCVDRHDYLFLRFNGLYLVTTFLTALVFLSLVVVVSKLPNRFDFCSIFVMLKNDLRLNGKALGIAGKS
jgi:hypothetical protein